mgnify:CR=1 FL=1
MAALTKPAFGDLLFWLYSLFMAGFFMFPEAPDHYKLYYAAVLLPVLLYGWKQPQPWRSNPLFWLLLAYVAYMSASALWSVPGDWSGVGQVAGQADAGRHAGEGREDDGEDHEEGIGALGLGGAHGRYRLLQDHLGKRGRRGRAPDRGADRGRPSLARARAPLGVQ